MSENRPLSAGGGRQEENDELLAGRFNTTLYLFGFLGLAVFIGPSIARTLPPGSSTFPPVQSTFAPFLIAVPLLLASVERFRPVSLLFLLCSILAFFAWVFLLDDISISSAALIFEGGILSGILIWSLHVKRQREADRSYLRTEIAEARERVLHAERVRAAEQTAFDTEETRLQRITDMYEVLKELTNLTRFDELKELLSHFLIRHFESRHAALVMAPGEGGKESHVRWLGASEPVVEALLLKNLSTLASQRNGLFVLGRGADPTFSQVAGEGCHGVFLPLLSAERLIGGLYVDLGEPGVAGELRFHVNRLRILSSPVASALYNVLLFDRVRELTVYDSLTGLMVYKYYMESLQREFDRSRERGLELALLTLDIDFFKSFNDRFGHQTGDEVLKCVSDCIRKSIRQTDTPSRRGGEEFAVILPQTDPEGARMVAERIRHMVETSTVPSRDQLLGVTISIGVCCFPSDVGTLEELIERSDAALYRAKKNGRNRVET